MTARDRHPASQILQDMFLRLLRKQQDPVDVVIIPEKLRRHPAFQEQVHLRLGECLLNLLQQGRQQQKISQAVIGTTNENLFDDYAMSILRQTRDTQPPGDLAHEIPS